MIFTDIGYIATGLFALAVASLAALAVMAWHADRRDPLTVVTAPACPCCTGAPYRVNDCTCREDCGVTHCQAADPPDLLGCPTGCGDPGCAGDCTWVTADALAELRQQLNEGDGRNG